MTVAISISLPEKVIEKLDLNRNDIGRSKYISKLLSAALQEPQTREEVRYVSR